MSESADTKAYGLWVQNKIIRKNLNKVLTGDIKFRKISNELIYLQGYIDGLADSGELSYYRYERLNKLIDAHVERNRKESEKEKGVTFSLKKPQRKEIKKEVDV